MIFLQVALRVESEETKAWLSELKFSEFLRIFLFDDDAMYGSYFLYVEYLWNLAKDNSNILVLMFEDIIKVLFWHKFHFIEFTCTQHYKVFAIRPYLRPTVRYYPTIG